MSIQVESALDTLKRQSLQVILGQIYIKSPTIKNLLTTYIKDGASSFSSLMLSSATTSSKSLSSDFINANMLLAYMDFYTLYALTYANYNVFNALRNISNSKFNYIYNLYKDAYSILTEKSFSNKYQYIKYCNFTYPKEIDISKSRINIRGNAVSEILGLDGTLTLPVLKSYEVMPSSVTFDYSDSSVHIIDQDIGQNYLFFNLMRTHTEKLGTLKISDPNCMIHRYEGSVPNISGYRGVPEISGTVYGHFSKEIHLIVDSIDLIIESNYIQTIWVKGSSNGYDWSAPFAVTPKVPAAILIDNNIAIGLSVTLYDYLDIAIADRFIMLLRDITISDPTLTLKLGFGALDKISYIKYNEISPYKLNVIPNSAILQKLKYDKSSPGNFVYDNRISQYFTVGGPVNKAEVSFTQSDYDIYSLDSSLYHKYSFMLSDIAGVVSEYMPHGGISLNSMDVKDLGTLAVYSNTFTAVTSLPHTLADPHPDTTYIEYNAYVKNESGQFCIPLLNMDFMKQNNYSPMMFEYVLPDDITVFNSTGDTGLIRYKQRFPINNQYKLVDNDFMKAYSISSGKSLSAIYDKLTSTTLIYNAELRLGYCLWYPLLIQPIIETAKNNPNDGSWILAGGDIYYMYYIDEEDHVHTAIRTRPKGKNVLMPFTGTIQPAIEIRSLAKPHVTPLVFDFALLGV